MLKKDSSKASKIKSPFQFLTCNIGQFIQFLLANKEGVITQRQYSVRTFRENQQKLATLFKQSTKMFEKNPLFSIKQPNLSISCKIR